MNVALPALIAFFLLLPGFILRTQLKRAERTSLDFSPFGQVVAEAVVWSLSAHSIWLFLSYQLANKAFEPLVLIKLLSGAVTVQESAAASVASSFNWIAAYFISLLIASFLFPKLLRSAIMKYRLDRSASRFSSIFRFHDAPWYYLLTGADFAEEDVPGLIMVSAIVEVAKEAILFVGVLDEFYVSPDGQLDRLVLQNVARRPIAKDKDSTIPSGNSDLERFYEVDGDSFVLRYSEAITLNIQYVRLMTEQSDSSTNTADPALP